jgi:hypothetical protein
VFENRVLRGIFGPKRDEVKGEWRTLHSAELHNLYSSPDIIRQIKSRRMRWAGHVARMGEGRNVYRVLVGKPEGKRPLGRPKSRWEDGIRMDLREIGWGVCSGFVWLRIGTGGAGWAGLKWILRKARCRMCSGRRPVVGPYKHGNKLYGSIKGGKFLTS